LKQRQLGIKQEECLVKDQLIKKKVEGIVQDLERVFAVIDSIDVTNKLLGVLNFDSNIG
jgi:hypothetical protein